MTTALMMYVIEQREERMSRLNRLLSDLARRKEAVKELIRYMRTRRVSVQVSIPTIFALRTVVSIVYLVSIFTIVFCVHALLVKLALVLTVYVTFNLFMRWTHRQVVSALRSFM